MLRADLRDVRLHLQDTAAARSLGTEEEVTDLENRAGPTRFWHTGPFHNKPARRTPKPSEMPVTYKDMYLTLMGRLIQLRTLLEASDPEMYKEVVDRWLDEHVKF